jgi:hypothetical protein
MKILNYVLSSAATVFVGMCAIIITFLSFIGILSMFVKDEDKNKHLTSNQIVSALKDIAEYGVCYTNSIIHANDISRESPVLVKVTKVENKEIWKVEEVKDNA